MATVKQLTRKLRALKSTRKITKAMKMIAFTRFRKALKAVQDSREYVTEMSALVARVAGAAETPHPFTLESKAPKGRILLVLFTTDRGLCGALNNNLLNGTQAFLSERLGKGEKITVLNAGKKGVDWFKKKKFDVEMRMEPTHKKVTPAIAAELADRLGREFAAGEWDEVFVAFNTCHSIIKLTPTLERLLPARLEAKDSKEAVPATMLLEPDADAVIDGAIRDGLRTRIYGCYLNAHASEHAARMTAMENATTNASSLIDHTTLVRNRIRQANITRELIEIISGVEAMKGT